jgi:hypothetical protein
MPTFEFGENAIVPQDQKSRFQEHRNSILDSIQPATLVESILAEELLHASWEKERVRDNSDITEAGPRLDDAYNRASRNWHRSLKQLRALQSARASHISNIYEPSERLIAAQTPLADIARIPKPLVHFAPETAEPTPETEVQ